MTPHRAAYTVSCIKRQMRARPDIRPAVRNAGIKPKPRAFTDIDALNHYTFTPQMRAHPDIGPSRISKINGLARSAEAGACKKCRVTGKYYVAEARKLHRHAPTVPAACFVSSTRDCTPTVTAVIIGVEHRRGLRALGTETHTNISPSPRLAGRHRRAAFLATRGREGIWT
jgi:hypothetical protein